GERKVAAYPDCSGPCGDSLSVPSREFRQAVENTAHDTRVDLPPLLNWTPRGRTAFLSHKGGTSMTFRTCTKGLARLAVCLLLCGLATLVGAQQPQQKDQGKKAAGQVEKRTYEFKEADKAMEYALFVPSRYDKEKKTPLMV